jgi:division protein CdvB (Snf7/Vps24/ESCRT-III family)
LYEQEVSKVMGQTVKGMSTAMKGMQVEQIAKTMGEFEKQFENMDVTSGERLFVDLSLLIHFYCYLIF